MDPATEVKPYPRGTIVHTEGFDHYVWVRTDVGWRRVSTTLGTIDKSNFTDKHVFVGSHQFGYIVTLPSEESQP